MLLALGGFVLGRKTRPSFNDGGSLYVKNVDISPGASTVFLVPLDSFPKTNSGLIEINA